MIVIDGDVVKTWCLGVADGGSTVEGDLSTLVACLGLFGPVASPPGDADFRFLGTSTPGADPGVVGMEFAEQQGTEQEALCPTQ